ncbi:Protein phosphatase [Carpediemonas membranifera]|uniref:Protein phosphatase n=1 Tax=Carpediemonas membranifera TaxID=201153 RepID=A0A8J6AQT1_9EUKA|nr:Protein phosphatase [Carpediemonas membranifera]|eukprot:KAG9391453.1 Protein phosphatase [Carpediemonas membranifera]
MGGAAGRFKPDHIRNKYAQALYREFKDRYQDSAQEKSESTSSAITAAVFSVFEMQEESSDSLVLDFAQTSLDDVSLSVIVQLVAVSAAVGYLNLNNKSLTIDHATLLADVLQFNVSLEHLELAACGLTSAHIDIIADALRRNDTLLSLNVSNNQLGVEGVKLLCLSLVEDADVRGAPSPIRRLALSGVGLDNHVSVIADIIGLLPRLSSLAVCDNNIDERGGQKIVRAVHDSASILDLDVRDNLLPEDQLVRVTQLCSRNTFALALLQKSIDDCLAGVTRDIVAPSVVPSNALDIKAAYAETVGRRPEMEDVVLLKTRYRDQPAEYFYAVYDGHGGRDSAEYAAATLLHLIAERCPASPDPASPDGQTALRLAIHNAFLECAGQMNVRGISDGTTALCAWIMGDFLITSNAGDSRAVLSREGRPVRLSFDHKPIEPSERQRIVSLGGFVEDKRVLGSLSVSRALGDFFLEPYVIPDPYVSFERLGPKDDFIILACDGLWDVVSDQAAVSLVGNERDPVQASIKLRDQAFLRGSTDNISVLVIMLKSR